MFDITLTGRPFNILLFHNELETANIEIVKCEFPSDNSFLKVFYVNEADGTGIQTVYNAHNANTLTTEQQETTQAVSAKTALQTLMTGLHGLSARDKGYVVLARIIASNDGASTPAILGLTTRANATAYVVTRANWLAVPSAARPMLGDILEAQAVALSATIAFLTG